MKQDSNVDIISAKYEISEDMRNSYIKSIGQEFLENEIINQLEIGIASEIAKKYANKIKIVENIEKGSVTYCCDIMVYNPKESGNKGIQEKKTGWVNVYKDYDDFWDSEVYIQFFSNGIIYGSTNFLKCFGYVDIWNNN